MSAVPPKPNLEQRKKQAKDLRKAHQAGKGICLIKAFGGGPLARNIRPSLAYCADFPHAHSVCVGMRSSMELRENVEAFPRAG